LQRLAASPVVDGVSFGVKVLGQALPRSGEAGRATHRPLNGLSVFVGGFSLVTTEGVVCGVERYWGRELCARAPASYRGAAGSLNESGFLGQGTEDVPALGDPDVDPGVAARAMEKTSRVWGFASPPGRRPSR
jgi:hypothetical protein